MANAWLAHVKRTMKAHKGQKFSAILKLAKKSYKKHRGGEDRDSDSGKMSKDSSSDLAKEVKKVDADGASDGAAVPAVKGGRRRRSSRRTRRHRRR